MKTNEFPESLLRAFKDVRITKKALRVVLKRERELFKFLHEERTRMRDSVPRDVRLSQYNAGYMRAMADLFEVISGQPQDWGGFKQFGFDRYRTVPDEHGRMTFKEVS